MSASVEPGKGELALLPGRKKTRISEAKSQRCGSSRDDKSSLNIHPPDLEESTFLSSVSFFLVFFFARAPQYV